MSDSAIAGQNRVAISPLTLERIQRSGLFDEAWYFARYPDAAASGMSALEHYFSAGAALGYDPSKKFSTKWYLERYQDVAASGINPLEHYVGPGSGEGRKAMPDIESLVARLAPASLVDEVARSGHFDEAWYVSAYPECAASGLSPIAHYLAVGAAAGNDPSPSFEGQWYLNHYRDVANAGMNPLVHYIRAGKLEGRRMGRSTVGGSVEPSSSPRERISALRILKSAYKKMPFSTETRSAHRRLILRHFPWLLGRESPQKEVRGHSDWDRGQHDKPADGEWEWTGYEWLRNTILNETDKIRQQFTPQPMTMHIADGDLAAHVANLRFSPAVSAPLVSIVIPVYNNVKLTVECLMSIEANTGSIPYEIIIADDASRDDTPKVMSANTGLRVLRSEKNLGFLQNCNEAFKIARGEFILLLNNDTQVFEGWLEALLETMSLDPNAGIVGPKVYYPSGHLQEAGCAVRSDGSVEMIGLNDDPEKPAYSYSRMVDHVSGVCMLIRRSLMAQLGGFSEEFTPCYCEDLDLCLRVSSMGCNVWYAHKARIAHHLSRTTVLQGNEFKSRCIAENTGKIIRKWREELELRSEVKPIAFYLPQYHPIPENDLWWGPGFTEWTNVAKAKPNFSGHYQPRMPADLGYYDLRVLDTMEKQARLARRYGVHGFCYYYYWFKGRRLLESPIENMLSHRSVDMPFCLCWANENWTRRWDGREREVLMAQDHSDEDDLEIIKDLARFFRDERYIRVSGRPMMLVYRPARLPSFSATAVRWREECMRIGLGPIHIVSVESMDDIGSGKTPRDYGCDAAIEFPPHGFGYEAQDNFNIINDDFHGRINDYAITAERMSLRNAPSYPRYPGVMPMWDNTARRQNDGDCFINAQPGLFQAWLESAIDKSRRQFRGPDRYVFINAWNEWAEGAYLEPDRRFGHSFLEAVRNALDSQFVRGRSTADGR